MPEPLPPKEEPFMVEQIVVGSHDVDPDSVLDISGMLEGFPLRISSLRWLDSERSGVLGRVSFGNPADDTYTNEEALLPPRLHVARKNFIEIVQRHEKAIKVASVVGVVLAAGVGLTIRKIRGTKN